MELVRVPTNGIVLRVAQEGPESGPLLLLLHGFPEYWAGWRHQIGAFAAMGWRVWAPELRGYGLSDKPEGIGAYSAPALVGDVVGLIDAAGCERAALAGHDWGGLIAWQVARAAPQRLVRLVTVNAPHPSAMRRRLLTDWRQAVRSWYALAFQLPWLPERIAGAFDGRLLARAMSRTSRPGTFGPEALAGYRAAWAQPGALRSMIHYYRAALRRDSADWGSVRVTTPTLIVWSTGDPFLVPELAADSARWCDDVQVELVDGATHWVLHEEPARTVALMQRFLGPPADRQQGAVGGD